MKTKLALLLLICPILCAQEKPAFTVPQTVKKVYEGEGCITGYEGYYLDLSMRWDFDVDAPLSFHAIGSTVPAPYVDPRKYVRVCVSKELAGKLLADTERKNKKTK